MAKTPQSLKVLVVDDDRAICEFMETFLEKSVAITWWCSI